MKKLMIIAVIFCLLLASCGKTPPENVHAIPTVKVSTPDEIWASDIYIKPEDITEDIKIVRIEKGTKLGDWVCPETDFYKYEQIKDYLKK